MGGAEGVHREDVAERGVAFSELLVVALLADVEAHVLEQADAAVTERIADRPGRVAQVVANERHLTTEQLGETLGDRGEGLALVELAFGRTPEVGHHHDAGAGLDRVLQRRQRGADALVGGDPPVLERHVQVLADEQPLPGERLLGQKSHASQPACMAASVVSSMRLEKPHSLSYQEQALTRVPPITRVMPASKFDEVLVWLKSIETSGASL